MEERERERERQGMESGGRENKDYLETGKKEGEKEIKE